MKELKNYVWLKTDKNRSGIYRLAVDLHESVVSITPNGSVMQFVGVNNLVKGNTFLVKNKKYTMVAVAEPSMCIIGEAEDGLRYLFDVREVIKYN